MKKSTHQLEQELIQADKKYALLEAEHNGLKHSFSLIKANFEREKCRLDSVLQSLANITKNK